MYIVTVGNRKQVHANREQINPSFTKLFGTHTFYQGGRGEGGGPCPPAISNTVAPMKVKFCRVFETSLNVSGMLKLFT